MVLFDANVTWKILSFFISSPSKEEHVKGISRSLKIGSGSASTLCKRLHKERLLNKQIKGNAYFYSLNNQNPLVKSLKRSWFLEQLMKYKNCWENREHILVVLYGSYASGEFIEKSDVDILVITNVKDREVFAKFDSLRESLKPELLITVLPLSKWREMAKKHDRFYTEVISNHILLYGSSIVIG